VGGCVLVVVLVCVFSGLLSLIIGLTGGAVGAVVAPDFHFRLVEGIVCPEGLTLEHREVRYSYHEPGEYTIEATCYGPGGQEIEGQAFKAIGAVMGLYFGVSFVVLFVLGLVFGVVLVKLFNRLFQRDGELV
jgi:hypothetical protein